MNKTYIDIVKHDGNRTEGDSSLILQFGIQSLSPSEIMNKSRELINWWSITEFLQLLQMHSQSQSKNKNDDVTNLLDLSDDTNPLEDKNYNKDINYDKIINTLELMSLINLYPGVGFEVFPLSKLKIGSIDLSQLLINKPIPPMKKLKTFKYGYLTVDEKNRLRPIDTNSIGEFALVGVWVYGLDIPEYQVDNEQNLWLTSQATNIVNKEDSKAQLLNSPYLWLACAKFMHDERVEKRLTASSKGSFVVVHFFHTSASPQFLEFRMVGNLNRFSKTADSKPIVNGAPKFLWLNNTNPRIQSIIPIEKLSLPKSINITHGDSESMWFVSKSVQKCIKEIFKKTKSGVRSSSKNSIGSNRISLNTVSSLGRLGATIDASHETFQDYIHTSKDRMGGPDVIQLKLHNDFPENIHNNVQMNRTRNSYQIATLKQSNEKPLPLKLVKASTPGKDLNLIS